MYGVKAKSINIEDNELQQLSEDGNTRTKVCLHTTNKQRQDKTSVTLIQHIDQPKHTLLRPELM